MRFGNDTEFGMWHRSPFEVRGRTYYHIEGWMQSIKHSPNPEFSQAIRATASASQARDMGAERTLWADLDSGKRPLTPREVHRWNDIKLEVLHEGLLAKFVQNPNLKRKLLDTGNEDLVYADPTSSAFYGQGDDGKGANHLGRMLMRVRHELRSIKKTSPPGIPPRHENRHGSLPPRSRAQRHVRPDDHV